MIRVTSTPPADWAERIAAASQSEGFAEAMRLMGYRPLYVWSAENAALALVRGWRLTARANLFATGAPWPFLRGALDALAARGVPYVKVGDTMWGVVADGVPPDGTPRLSVTPRHTFVLDLAPSEADLLRGMDGAERKIRKAEKEGVVVRPVESAADLAAFCQLSHETSDRVRARTAYTDFPPAFFETLHERMASTGAARFYVAWHDTAPLAACVFLTHADTMLYYLGGSTRNRELTTKQAPTAVFWRAIRDAKRLGVRYFDLGGCTPTEDVNDSRHGVYAFKKRWGGRLQTFYNVEAILSPFAYRLQERVVTPLWDRLHPMYFRLLDAAHVLRRLTRVPTSSPVEPGAQEG